MFRLENPLQHYAWGSKDEFTRRFSIPNPTGQPMAELWMGVHPNGCSQAMVEGKSVCLADLLEQHPELLGEQVCRRYNGLPFLFKVLAVEQPLSIQLHPGRSAAREGFERENQLGVALDSPSRQFKDPNHKPELLYSLSPFTALNGFRPLSEQQQLLAPLSKNHPQIAQFIHAPSGAALHQLLEFLLNLTGEPKQRLLQELKIISPMQHGEAWRLVESLAQQWSEDMGVLMPLMLNIVHLAAGEAMFIPCGTIHAYLHGVGLELMANSDNVLRAGLTGKTVAVQQLLNNLNTRPLGGGDLLVALRADVDHQCRYPVAVEEFSFITCFVNNKPQKLPPLGPAILFCIDGEVQCRSGQQRMDLRAGQSLFLSAQDPKVRLEGAGQVAIAAVNQTALSMADGYQDGKNHTNPLPQSH